MLRIVGYCCVQYVQYQTMLQLHACVFHQRYKIKRTRQLLKPQASSGGATVCFLKRKLSFRTGHLEIHRLSESVDFIPCIHTVGYDKRHVLRHILYWFWLAFAVIERQAWIIFSKDKGLNVVFQRVCFCWAYKRHYKLKFTLQNICNKGEK